MSEWWEKAYPGHPMEPAKFARPLYPPDAKAHGKKPSTDAKDVLALKRTISRAGRWPWQAFDDSFSNAFAHGKANVSESGLAGFQRVQKIDATGWLGEKTFNALRSALIPEPLPHAGEPIMDATAVNLFNEAWEMFQGSEPQTGTLRRRALDRAITQLGYTESPAGSNLTKYGEWYGMNGQPWCAMFCTWCYVMEGGVSFSFDPSEERYAYVPYIVADARAHHYGLSTTDDPIPGDLVCYDWEGNGEYDHVGLFECWTSGTSSFQAIEGNTSYGNQSNGGQTMRRDRTRGGQGTVFVRVDE